MVHHFNFSKHNSPYIAVSFVHLIYFRERKIRDIEYRCFSISRFLENRFIDFWDTYWCSFNLPVIGMWRSGRTTPQFIPYINHNNIYQQFSWPNMSWTAKFQMRRDDRASLLELRCLKILILFVYHLSRVCMARLIMTNPN